MFEMVMAGVSGMEGPGRPEQLPGWAATMITFDPEFSNKQMVTQRVRPIWPGLHALELSIGSFGISNT